MTVSLGSLDLYQSTTAIADRTVDARLGDYRRAVRRFCHVWRVITTSNSLLYHRARASVTG